MPNSKIILTKTSRPNATPHPDDLDYGELAINYEDGLLFFKNASNRISKIASSGSFSQLTRHLADRENPHEVTAEDVGLKRVDNTNDVEKPISLATQIALDTKVNLTTLNSDYYDRDETDGRISTKFGEIDILINPPSSSFPAGNLDYNVGSNTFTFTKATIPTLSDLGGLGTNSVVITAQDPAGGTGVLTYQGAGVFIYDTPTIGGLGGYAKTEIGLNLKTADRSFDGTLTYNDGKFTYDKPSIAGITANKITLVDGVLNINGYVTQAQLNALDERQGSDDQARRNREGELDSEITNLQEQISNNDDDISSLQEQITSNDGDITDLQQKDVNLQEQISNNDDDISSLQEQISNNDDDISSLQEQVSNNDGDISSLSGRITANDNEINALEIKDTSLQSQINSNDTEISDLQSDKVDNLGSVTGIQKLTQAAYDQLTPNASTVYIIVD